MNHDLRCSEEITSRSITRSIPLAGPWESLGTPYHPRTAFRMWSWQWAPARSGWSWTHDCLWLVLARIYFLIAAQSGFSLQLMYWWLLFVNRMMRCSDCELKFIRACRQIIETSCECKTFLVRKESEIRVWFEACTCMCTGGMLNTNSIGMVKLMLELSTLSNIDYEMTNTEFKNATVSRLKGMLYAWLTIRYLIQVMSSEGSGIPWRLSPMRKRNLMKIPCCHHYM